MEDGQGLGKLIPPIKESDYYLKEYKNLRCMIEKGMKGTIVVNGISYNEEMPGVKHLSEAELCNLINFMNSKWYPQKNILTPADLSDTFNDCESYQHGS